MRFISKIALVVTLALGISGCERSPEEFKAAQDMNAQRNTQSFSAPTKVGTLFTGQPVYLATIAYSGRTSRDNQTHYVYFVPGASSESANWRKPSGKHTVPMVNTMIELGPNPTPDQVIQMAEKLKKEQEQADLDQLNTLCKKYGCKE